MANKRRTRKTGVLARIKSLTLTPRWYRRTSKQFDPPQANQDPVFQRKVRMTIGATAVGGFVNFRQIATLAGIQTTGDQIFNNMVVKRVDIWGADVDTLSIKFYKQGTKTPDATFTDVGTIGARRPHLSVYYPAHALYTQYKDYWDDNIMVFMEETTKETIVDFHVSFWQGRDDTSIPTGVAAIVS